LTGIRDVLEQAQFASIHLSDTPADIPMDVSSAPQAFSPAAGERGNEGLDTQTNDATKSVGLNPKVGISRYTLNICVFLSFVLFSNLASKDFISCRGFGSAKHNAANGPAGNDVARGVCT
jgi:hypothetical protein